MYLSTKQFYQHYLSKLPVETLYPHFITLEKLITIQGVRKLKKQKTLSALQKISPETVSLIQMLIALQRFTKKEVKMLTKMMRNQLDDNGIYFKITAPDLEIEKIIENSLKQQYQSPVIEIVTSEILGIKVEGEGLAYQRNLEQDLKNIFNNLSLSLPI